MLGKDAQILVSLVIQLKRTYHTIYENTPLDLDLDT